MVGGLDRNIKIMPPQGCTFCCVCKMVHCDITCHFYYISVMYCRAVQTYYCIVFCIYYFTECNEIEFQFCSCFFITAMQ